MEQPVPMWLYSVFGAIGCGLVDTLYANVGMDTPLNPREVSFCWSCARLWHGKAFPLPFPPRFHPIFPPLTPSLDLSVYCISP